MNDDEEFLFQQEMSGVKPLQRSERVTLERGKLSTAAAEQRRAAATAEPGDKNPLAVEGIEALDPWYVLSFKRPGVQNGVFRKLKQGRYEAEARLNLHRMSVKRARLELFEFVQQAEDFGMRSVQVVHGKGENSDEREQASVIKGCVDHWLRQFEQVQAFHSARPQHGGTGAVYVLLRKSEKQKQLNRERYNKGRERE
jgi:DNA-nicking Smr family endonuclease